MVLEIGELGCFCQSIQEGNFLAQRNHQISGRHLTSVVQKMLVEQQIDYVKSFEIEFVRDIKEQCCLIAMDQQKLKPIPYKLPDGKEIIIEREVQDCITPELF